MPVSETFEVKSPGMEKFCLVCIVSKGTIKANEWQGQDNSKVNETNFLGTRRTMKTKEICWGLGHQPTVR